LNNRKGQSLVEMLIAVAVVAVVVSSLTMLGISAMRSSDQAKKKSTAVKLANKGIELVRYCRDQSDSWSAFLSDCASPSGWSVPADYTGQINIVEEVPGRALVTVTVSFTDSAGTHDSVAETYLTNWY
jgi:Tfp pilus assembly protein PilV